MSLKARATSRTSSGPLAVSARAARSPPSAARVASRRSVRGRLTHRASHIPARATTDNTISAIDPSTSQYRRTSASTREVGTLARTAPYTRPPDATGTAT